MLGDICGGFKEVTVSVLKKIIMHAILKNKKQTPKDHRKF